MWRVRPHNMKSSRSLALSFSNRRRQLPGDPSSAISRCEVIVEKWFCGNEAVVNFKFRRHYFSQKYPKAISLTPAV